MTSGMKTVMYPVRDIAAAKQLYGKLFGVAPYMDERFYVGFTSALRQGVVVEDIEHAMRNAMTTSRRSSVGGADARRWAPVQRRSSRYASNRSCAMRCVSVGA